MRREGRREIAASDSPSSPASASASAPCSSLLRSVPLLLLSPHVLIESANLVKTIHYFTIMMAAAPAHRPFAAAAIAAGRATDNFGSNKRPRRDSAERE